MKTISYHRRKFFFAPLALVALALFSWVTMLLWNALLPAIFNFSAITFWQSLGLLVLARLLFGSMHPRWRTQWPHSVMDHDLRRKIKNMSPDEREEFFRKMHYNRQVWRREYNEEKEPEDKGKENE